jgi:branched-chain amino acid transport system substrate-binding protein
LQGPALADVIVGDGKSKPSIIARKDSYGEGFSAALKDALVEKAATPGEPVLYDPEGAAFDGDVDKVIAQAPDSVVIIGFNDDGAKIVQEMIKKGVGPDKIDIYTADGMQSSKFGATVDPANPGVVSGIKGTAPAASPSGIDHPFGDVFAAKDVDPIFSAYYYDCAMLFALAAQSAASDAGSDIAKAVEGVVTGDEDCQTFADCKKFLEDGKTIAYKGASQNFDGWQGFEPGSGSYDVWSYDATGAIVTETQQIKVGG